MSQLATHGAQDQLTWQVLEKPLLSCRKGGLKAPKLLAQKCELWEKNAYLGVADTSSVE